MEKGQQERDQLLWQRLAISCSRSNSRCGPHLGNVWLGGPANRYPPHLTAFANQDRLSVPVNEPLERLLRNATHITVQLADREKSIDLDRHRMSKLLKAVDRCRRAALK